VAYGLGRVPPERIGFRDTLILAFPEPQRPSRSAGSAALRLSLCPASRPSFRQALVPYTCAVRSSQQVSASVRSRTRVTWLTASSQKKAPVNRRATLPVGSRTATAAQQTLGSGSLRQPSSTGQRARAAQNKWTRVRRFRGAALLHRLCTANLLGSPSRGRSRRAALAGSGGGGEPACRAPSSWALGVLRQPPGADSGSWIDRPSS
jgi:hypothetical protein